MLKTIIKLNKFSQGCSYQKQAFFSERKQQSELLTQVVIVEVSPCFLFRVKGHCSRWLVKQLVSVIHLAVAQCKHTWRP